MDEGGKFDFFTTELETVKAVKAVKVLEKEVVNFVLTYRVQNSLSLDSLN